MFKKNYKIKLNLNYYNIKKNTFKIAKFSKLPLYKKQKHTYYEFTQENKKV